MVLAPEGKLVGGNVAMEFPNTLVGALKPLNTLVTGLFAHSAQLPFGVCSALAPTLLMTSRWVDNTAAKPAPWATTALFSVRLASKSVICSVT